MKVAGCKAAQYIAYRAYYIRQCYSDI